MKPSVHSRTSIMRGGLTAHLQIVMCLALFSLLPERQHGGHNTTRGHST